MFFSLQKLKTIFDFPVGFSDHTLGSTAAIVSVGLGASVIEKHFTLNRSLQGPDHAASLEPFEMKAMVVAIRNIEKAMGDGVKKPSPSEIKNIHNTRKSIVAKKPIKKGDYFSEDNLNNGIRIKTSSYTRHHVNATMCKAKANGNYINSMLALQEALNCGYDEALLLDVHGYVSEGSGENLFSAK